MELSSEQYGQVVSWMDRAQRRVAELEAENRELRRQLEELRRGVGISVVIEGRAIPVATPTAPHAGTNASQYPAWQPSYAPAPVSRPAFPAFPTYPASPRYPTYSAPLEAPQMAPRSAPTPDSTWLTGQMRAVRAPVTQADATSPRRAVAPSQNMTPAWLREEVPLPAPRVPPAAPSWPSAPLPAASRPRTLASATGKQPAVRSPLRQGQLTAAPAPAQPRRPVAPKLESEHLPSLAQMTGHQPAVRLPGGAPAERSPFSDSFVLG